MTDKTHITEKLRLAVAVYRKMRDARFDGGSVFGRLELTADNCALVASLHEHGLVYQTDAFDVSRPGESADLELQPETRDRFVETIAGLLEYHDALKPVLQHFYIAELDLLYEGEFADLHPFAAQYMRSIRAIDLARCLADHQDEVAGTERLVFLHKEKLAIPVKLQPADFRCPAHLEGWERIMSEPTHQEQRKTIFKSVLLERLSGVSEDRRAAVFLDEFDDLFQRFQASYALYVSEFSFDKVMATVREKNLAYTIRINKVLTDIQSQVLALPVALILVGGQMKEASDFTLANVLIFIGACVYALMIGFLIKGQHDNLDAVLGEIDAEQKHLERALRAKKADVFRPVRARHARQVRLLYWLAGLIAIAWLFSAWLLFHNSGYEFQPCLIAQALNRFN